jgi:hypothetical protein
VRLVRRTRARSSPDHLSGFWRASLLSPSIVSAIGAESRDGGLSYEVPVGDGGGCVVTKILSNQMEVSAALKAGDRVAANPAKTLGLTVHDAHESSCVTQLTQELKGLS